MTTTTMMMMMVMMMMMMMSSPRARGRTLGGQARGAWWLPGAGATMLIGMAIGLVIVAADLGERARALGEFDTQIFSLVLLPIIIFEARGSRGRSRRPLSCCRSSPSRRGSRGASRPEWLSCCRSSSSRRRRRQHPECHADHVTLAAPSSPA